MNKKTLLNFWVLLLCMVVGGVSTAWGDETYTLTITASDFNTTSYAANNNEKTSNAVCTTDNTKTYEVKWTSNQVMKNSEKIQWQKNKGYIYNSTDLGTINSVTVTSPEGSFTTYYGTEEQPSSGAAGSGKGYFKTSVGDATGKASSVEISFTISTGGDTPKLENSDLALTNAPIALNFDLYNNNAAQVINYTTSSTGAVSIDESDYATFAINEANKTITVTPKTSVTPSAQTITVNQAADETYNAGSATFTLTITDSTPIPTHQVTFSINGVTSSNEVEEGADIVFPDDPSDISGKTFMGWTTEAINGTADEAPEFVTSAVMGQNDVTFYAVFATVEESGNSLQKMQSGDTFVAGDKIVVVAVNGNNKYGMYQQTQSNSYVKYYSFSEDYNTIILDDKNWWTVSSGSDGKWKLGDSTNGYLYNSGNNNLSVDKSNATEWTLEDKGNGTFSLKGSRYLSCRTDLNGDNTNLYRMAGSDPTGIYAFSIYKLSDGISYSEYCTTVVAAAVEKPVITLAENPFLFSTTATITCETEGAAIKYSFDGETWNDYSSALDITATTTIYAKATKGNDESSVAQVTATKNLAEATVTIDATGITNDNVFNGTTAGSLSASVTYNEEAIEGAAVTWSGNNDEVATINASTGAVTLVGAGSVTFTATYAGNSDFSEKSATYEMTVINDDPNAPGKQGNPYTVTQALEVINALENNASLDDKYVTGKVSQIDSYSSGSITYWISVDGTTTSQMQVYKGKGIAGANFSAVTDLELGDQVVVFGQLKKYVSGTKVTPEFNTGSRLISRTEKPASDLTKTGDITLDYKNDAIDADLTEYFTTSSTGAITYTVADKTVIENADELISALKVGTTTVTVSQAATLSYKAGEIVINVTVQDTRVPATTIPAINISTLKFGAADGTISVVNPVKADDGVTFSFASDNEDVLLIDGTTYTVGEIGSAQVTVTATPSDSKLYTPVVETFDVLVEAAVKSNNEILLDYSYGSTVYGTPKSVDYAVSDGYEGELDYVIDNDAIADVEIGASAITFTPKAVGTAVITISAPATASFNAAESVQYTLTVTAPEGGTEAVVASETLFSETFDECDGTGGNDGQWSGTIASSTLTADNKGWAFTNGNGASKCAKFGAGSKKGSAKTPAIGGTGTLSLSFRAAAWNGNSEGTTLKISVSDGNIDKSSVTLTKGEFNTYTATITNATAETTITFEAANASNNRFFLDDVLVEKAGASIQATLNGSGYATFCSQYPLDFSAANGYTAWQVKSISGEVVTFEKITGTIKGGQGILLKGEAGATVTMESDDSEVMLNGNLLFGTTAPTYVDNEEYLGLSGNKFVKVNAGTIPAGKALLPVSVLPAGARELTFLFDEGGQTTGISEQITVNGEKSVYDLQGRKVEKTTKGLYIVNGRKVVVK